MSISHQWLAKEKLWKSGPCNETVARRTRACGLVHKGVGPIARANGSAAVNVTRYRALFEATEHTPMAISPNTITLSSPLSWTGPHVKPTTDERALDNFLKSVE